ncbi:MAG: outer membrane protein assembly factor BamB family protein [Candidatus Heimdallarchaeota archaeon]
MSFTKKSLVIILLVGIIPIVSLYSSIALENNLEISGLVTGANIGNGSETMHPDSGELWNYKQGLAGEITCRPVLDTIVDGIVKQIVYIGTEVGLAKIEVATGNIYWFHTTPGAVLSIEPIIDVTEDGVEDVLLTFDNQLFNNTELIDGQYGDMIWSFRPTTTSWVDGLGFSDQETRSWSIMAIQKTIPGGTLDVAVSSYNTIYGLNGADGSVKWTQTFGNDIWNVISTNDDLNADGYYEIIAGTQDGELIVLSGKDGAIIWSVIAAQQEQTEDPILGIVYYDQNVYDVLLTSDVTGDGKQDILVTTETGFTQLYDVTTGLLIDQLKIFTRTGLVNSETYYGMESFYNVFVMDTDTIPGSNQYLTIGRSSSVFGNSSLSLYSVVGNSLVLDWASTTIDIENVRDIATTEFTNASGTFTKMVIPYGSSNSMSTSQKYGVYFFENRTFIEERFLNCFNQKYELDVYFGGGDMDLSNNPFTGNYAMFVDDFAGSANKEMLIYFEGNGLFALEGDSGNLLWKQSISTLEYTESYADVNGDLTNEILEMSYYLPDNWRPDYSFVTNLALIDGATGDSLWTHEMSYHEQLGTRGGYNHVIQGEDLTGDGVPDLWLTQQEWETYEPYMQNLSKITVLNGVSGAVVWDNLPANKSLVYSKERLGLVDATLVSDQNSDGYQDILVTTIGRTLNCLSGFDGSYLWNLTGDTNPADPHYRYYLPYWDYIHNVGDLLGNYTDDILIVGDGQIRLVDSDDFNTEHWVWTQTMGWMDEQTGFVHIDLANNETYFVFSYNHDDKEYTSFLNLRTGVIDSEIPKNPNNFILDPFVADFNGDSIRDHLLFIAWGDDTGFREGYYSISGTTGTPISYFSLFRPQYETNLYFLDQYIRSGAKNFFDIIEDQNGDSVPDMIFGWSVGRYDDEDFAQGMVIEVVDMTKTEGEVIAKYDFVENIKDEFSHPVLLPTLSIRNLGDISNSGGIDVLVSLYNDESEIITTILDLETEYIWKEISSLATPIDNLANLTGDLENRLVFRDEYGRVRTLAPDFWVNIDPDIEVVSKNSGHYRLTWNSNAEEVIASMYIDNQIIATNIDNIVDIYMSNGKHTVSVSITDRNGVSAYASVTLDNEGASGVFIIWIVIGVAILVYVGLKFFFLVKRKEDLTMFGPDVTQPKLD